MIELKDLPWECVAVEPKEPESWKELYELMIPISSEDEIKEKFFDQVDLFIPYYVSKWKQIGFQDIEDLIFYCLSVSRLLGLIEHNSKKFVSYELIQHLNIISAIEAIQEFSDELDFYYTLLVLNTAVILYQNDQTRDEAVRLLLTNRSKILGKIDAFNFDFINNFDPKETLLVTLKFLSDNIDNMEKDEQEQWILILTQLVYVAHYFVVDPVMINEYFSFSSRVNELSISEVYKHLIELNPYMLLGNIEDQEEELSEQEAKKIFATLKKFINRLNQKILEQLGEDTLLSILERIYYYNGWKEKVGEEFGKWIKQRNFPEYKKRILSNFLSTKIDDLFKSNHYDLIVRLHRSWFNEDQRERAERYALFELAYSYNEQGYPQKAKEFYERYLKEKGESPAVLNNLAVIYRNVDKNLDLALKYFQRAYELDPEQELYLRNLKKTEEMIKEREKRPKLLKERYFKTEKAHKKILFSIYNLMGEGTVTEEKLQEVAGFGSKLTRLLNELMKKELVHWNQQQGYYLDPDIVELVKNWVDPQLQRQIIKHSRNKLYKPIFFHESEYRLYRVLVELFPQHLIFPNMSLQSIIDYEKLKPHVESDVFEYYLKAHVDFAVINTTNYLPLILFEKDSEYHDEGKLKENTKKKNLIFQIAGLPLVRLRFNNNMDEDRLKEQVKQVTKELFSQLLHSENDYDQEILSQFDLKAFGIVRDPLDLNAVDLILKDRLGEVVYGYINEMNWQEEDGILLLKVNSSIRPVLELAWGKLKEELYQQFPAINRLDILWVEQE